MFATMKKQRRYVNYDCKHLLVDFADRNLAFNRKESNSRYRKYQCPWCGSGTGKHKTGNLTIYTSAPTYFKCFVCGVSGNIYKLAGIVYGLSPETQFKEICRKLLNEFNMDVPTSRSTTPKEYVPVIVPKVEPPLEDVELEKYTEQLARADIVEAEKHLEECNYLTYRGIPTSIQRRFHCGYLKAWVHPKIRASVHDDYSQIDDSLKSDRVIIPDGDLENLRSYTARAIHEKDEANGRKAMKTANPQVFNANVLKSEEPQVVFLVEGAIDSMSIETVGFNSIAIGSTAYVDKFFTNYTVNPNTTLIVALDNDTAGIKATKQIVEQCKRREIYCLVADMDIYGSCKDANELLQCGRELLKENLNRMVKKCEDIDLKNNYFKECKLMKEMENNTVPEEIGIVTTENNEYPEVTYENIMTPEVINYFGKLKTRKDVQGYYMYLTQKAKEFRRMNECKSIFDYAKRTVLEHIRDWENSPILRATKEDLPEWLIVTERGKVYINETIYCKRKIAEKNIRTIDGKIYDIDGEISEDGLKREIVNDISPYINVGLYRNADAILKAIKLFTGGETLKVDTKNLHLLNGTIDISQLRTTGQYTFSSNKEWCINRLNVNFDPNAKKPVKFLKLLSELLEDDDITTLQEYMGYGMVPTTDAQKMLFIVGNGGEGKSLLGKIYKQVLGANNVYSAHIQKLQNRPCELANCVGKLMNIDDDTEATAFGDTGTLKEIISGGDVTVEPKYVQPYSTTLYTRLMCFSNASLQALYDRSDGYYRRQLIIRTKPKAKNRVDNPNLLNDILADELEGIFLWCLEGLKRLTANNYIFTVSESSKNLLELSKREGFNFIEYLEDTNEVVFDENHATTSVELYEGYCIWCHQNGKDIIKRNTVISWLKKHAHEYQVKDDCNIIDRHNGRRCRGFKGIRLIGYSQNVCCA